MSKELCTHNMSRDLETTIVSYDAILRFGAMPLHKLSLCLHLSKW